MLLFPLQSFPSTYTMMTVYDIVGRIGHRLQVTMEFLRRHLLCVAEANMRGNFFAFVPVLFLLLKHNPCISCRRTYLPINIFVLAF